MTTISTYKDLQQAIRELEARNDLQIEEIRDDISNVFESITPGNILKTVIHQFSVSPELKNSAINTAIGLGTGFVTRKLYVGKSAGFLKKIAGTALQFAVTNFVRKKAPAIREKFADLAERATHKKG